MPAKRPKLSPQVPDSGTAHAGTGKTYSQQHRGGGKVKGRQGGGVMGQGRAEAWMGGISSAATCCILPPSWARSVDNEAAWTCAYNFADATPIRPVAQAGAFPTMNGMSSY